MKVSDLMAKHVEFIDPDATVQDAASLMGELDVSALPVGTAAWRPGGIVNGASAGTAASRSRPDAASL